MPASNAMSRSDGLYFSPRVAANAALTPASTSCHESAYGTRPSCDSSHLSAR